MLQGKSKYTPLIALSVDVLLLLNTFFISTYFRFDGIVPNTKFYSILIGLWILVWVFISLKYNLFEIPRIIQIQNLISKNIEALFVFTFVSSSLLFFITDYKFSRLFFIMATFIFSTFILLWRIIWISLIKYYRQKGYNYRKIVLVGLKRPIVKC